MSENIGSAITGLVNFNVNTLIPSLSENADIQEAFRIYHYGAPSGSGSGQYNPSNTNPANLKNPSIAHSFYSLQTQINNLVLGVPASTWTAKGALVTATATSTVSTLPVGVNGAVLTADSSQTSGLNWIVPEITLVNNATLSNKTLISPIINLSFNSQTASYILGLSDRSKIIEMSNTSANTVTIPDNATVAFPNGTQITIVQTNSGQTSVIGASGVTLNCTPQNTPNCGKLRSQWSSLTLIKRDTNTWIAIGDLTA